MKERYDQKALVNITYYVGDLVTLRNSVIQNNVSRKFHLFYCGSYCVVEVLPPVNYAIESLHGSTPKRVHFNGLKKNCGRIKEKSTAQDDKFNKNYPLTTGQIATWDYVDHSPQVNQICHRVTILIVVDQIGGPEVR